MHVFHPDQQQEYSSRLIRFGTNAIDITAVPQHDCNVLASSSGMVSSNTLTTVSATNKANFIALIDKSQMNIFDRIRRLNEKPIQSPINTPLQYVPSTLRCRINRRSRLDHLVDERLWCNLWAPQLIQGMKESASLIDSPALVSQDGLDCHCEENRFPHIIA